MPWRCNELIIAWNKPNDDACKCGVPGCQGHEIDESGEVHVPNHPRGHLVLHLGKEVTHGHRQESRRGEA
jgi:hypothetical protein